MTSIIIPAYNEEAVIGRTLRCLLEGAEIAGLEIVVCCNGCTDLTAEIARSFGPPVQVVETSKASKTVALNMGDYVAKTFPRIYLDADILMDYATVNSIVRALEDEDALAVAPRMRVDLTNRNWAIRAYHEVWLKTPYHLRGMIGSGIYALSRNARSRFAEFPEIIADDEFVRAHFGPNERITLEDCTFTMIPPRTFSGLLRITTRSKLGIKELSLTHPELMRNFATLQKSAGSNSDYFKLLARPLLWPKLAIYAFVKAIASTRAMIQMKRLGTYCWERDESSRVNS